MQSAQSYARARLPIALYPKHDSVARRYVFVMNYAIANDCIVNIAPGR
jgi:hypothetical protein